MSELFERARSAQDLIPALDCNNTTYMQSHEIAWCVDYMHRLAAESGAPAREDAIVNPEHEICRNLDVRTFPFPVVETRDTIRLEGNGVRVHFVQLTKPERAPVLNTSNGYVYEWIAHEAGVNYEHAKAAAERKVHNGVKGELAEIRSTSELSWIQNALEIDSPTWVDKHVVFQGDRWTYRDEESGDAIDTLVAKDRTTNDCKDASHPCYLDQGSHRLYIDWVPGEGGSTLNHDRSRIETAEAEPRAFGYLVRYAPQATPTTGDVDGDGTEEPLRYEPSSGEFLVGDEPVFVFPSKHIRPDPEGKNGLRTFTGDFDGDGRLDFAIHVRSKSEFRIATRTGNTRVQRMGTSTDLPLVGDFDKDGSDEIAIYSQGMRAFYYSNFERAGMVYGARMRLNYTGSFQAMSGDTDGDGRDEFILYHPSAEFLISQIGSTSTTFGSRMQTAIALV